LHMRGLKKVQVHDLDGALVHTFGLKELTTETVNTVINFKTKMTNAGTIIVNDLRRLLFY